MKTSQNVTKLANEVRTLAARCRNFDEFYTQAHLIDYKKIVAKNIFARLISVVSVEFSLK